MKLTMNAHWSQVRILGIKRPVKNVTINEEIKQTFHSKDYSYESYAMSNGNMPRNIPKNDLEK